MEFALLFKFRNVSINLRESILFHWQKEQPNSKYHSTIERSIWRERVARGETYQIFLRFPLLFLVETFVDEKETKTGRKRWRGKKGREERRAGHASLRLQTVPNRPTRIWRWYLEKKHEMIDDRPILVATYGVPYPRGCSYNGHCRNLFPQAGDVTSPMSFESKFLLNDSQV